MVGDRELEVFCIWMIYASTGRAGAENLSTSGAGSKNRWSKHAFYSCLAAVVVVGEDIGYFGNSS